MSFFSRIFGRSSAPKLAPAPAPAPVERRYVSVPVVQPVPVEKAAAAPQGGSWIDLAMPLIQQFEGYAKKTADGGCAAYPDPASGGEPWTIGWGSTGPGITKGTVWTRAQADERLRRDIGHFGNGVKAALDGAPTTDAQLAALVSFAYNVGLRNLRTSTLLKLHKAGSYRAAGAQFARWNKAAGKVLPGLTKRRAAEAALYGGGA